MRLEGKVALVTGGGSGIGEGIVRRFAAEGAIVYLGDVDVQRGQAIAAETGARFLSLDVSSSADWARIATDIGASHGQLDILVNNAGVISSQAIDAIEEAAWARVMAVNVTGPMLGCRTAIRMVQAAAAPRALSIINVASTTSFLGLANDVAYTASKHAILGLTRSAARALCAGKAAGADQHAASRHDADGDPAGPYRREPGNARGLRRHVADGPDGGAERGGRGRAVPRVGRVELLYRRRLRRRRRAHRDAPDDVRRQAACGPG